MTTLDFLDLFAGMIVIAGAMCLVILLFWLLVDVGMRWASRRYGKRGEGRRPLV